jgi:hypothetical protein
MKGAIRIKTEKKNIDGFIKMDSLNTQKRIGSTVYEVEVYVKKDDGETIEDKIMRLIRNDLQLSVSYAKIDEPKLGRLPERITE